MNSFLEKYVAPLWWLWMGVFAIMYMTGRTDRDIDICINPLD